MSLNPKVTDLGNNVRLTWTPDLTGQGYRLYVDGVAVSRTFKPDASSTTFSKPSDGSHRYGLQMMDVVGNLEEVVFPVIEPEPELPSYPIPHWKVTLPAGVKARWRQYRTALTPPASSGHIRIATPASPRTDVTKSWVWWILASIIIPADTSVSKEFAFMNGHNSPGDVGGGLGWNWGDGVSCMHLFDESDNQIRLQHQPNFPGHLWNVVPFAEAGLKYDFVIKAVFGRLDRELGLAGPGVSGGGIGDHPNDGRGRTMVWVNGNNTPAIDTGPINNLQRAGASQGSPDGKTYTQTLIERHWDGIYGVQGHTTTQTAEVFTTRLGRTLTEALSDGEDGFVLGSEWESGSTQNLPDFDSKDFKVPASLL